MADLEKITKKRLGEILLAEGVIQPDQLQMALAKQQLTGELIGEALVKEGVTTEADIAKTLCAQFGKPFLRPTKYDIAKEVLALLPPKLMAEHNFVPIDRFGNLLVIAMGGLLDAATVAQIQKLTNCEIDVYVSTASDVKSALRSAFPDLYDPLTMMPKLDTTGQLTGGVRLGAPTPRPEGAAPAVSTSGSRRTPAISDATLGLASRGNGAPGNGSLGRETPGPGKTDTQRRFPEIPDTRKIEGQNVAPAKKDFAITNSQLGMTTGEMKSMKAEEDSDWDALFQEAEENVMRRLEADGGPNFGPGSPNKK